MNLRFQINRAIDFYKRNGLISTIRKVFTKAFYMLTKNSQQRKFDKEERENYQIWIKENEPTLEELDEQRKTKFEYEPKISVIVPMYNTKEKYLKELIDSLIEQTYVNWELCLADGSDSKRDYVDNLVTKDERIKYKFLNANKGISENSNEALKLATGEYMALLDHDDILPIFSLYEIVKVINKNKEAEFIYTDEDKIFEDKENRLGPHFKQDFAPDTLMSYNYICHFSIFKKSLMDKLGGFRKEFDGSQDYDLIFRATEQANQIIHIPKILYHWRMNENSVALSSDAKPYAYEAAKRVIADHMKRVGIKGKVEDSAILGIYKIKYEVQGNPKVSIIIANKDHKKDLKTCVESILEYTTYKNYEIVIVENNSETKEIKEYYKELKKNPQIKIVEYKEKGFNYSRINNFGVKNASGEYIVLLNNDTKIVTEDWIENMVGNCQREDVGIVGTKLLYANGKVQHAGVVLGLTGIAGHINSGLDYNDPGYMARNIISQNYSAVTGAMMMISKKDYEDVGGLDENFPVAYNDIDLCLKIRAKNKVIVMNPNVVAYHFESKTRGYEISAEKVKRLEEDSQRLKNKWKDVFEKEDPYFNPNFRKDVGTMRVKTKETRSKKKVNSNKKTLLAVIIACLITIIFFTYNVCIAFDSAHYLWLTSLLTRADTVFSNWDVARGPIFPLFIKICNKLFGKSINGLLIGMYLFYILMLVGCYYIYKDTIKNEKYCSKKIKAFFIIGFIILILINPMIFGYYHSLLTEFIAITVAVISCYISWKLIQINAKENKKKYILETIFLAFLAMVMWLLKQPYVGTVIFPLITASIISFIRNSKLYNFVQRTISILICCIAIVVGVQIWNFVIKIGNVETDNTRISSGFLASRIVGGITEYSQEKGEEYYTIDGISNNDKIDENDKKMIIDILNKNSGYKTYKVMRDSKKEKYKIIYLKSDDITTGEAIKYWFDMFKENPRQILEGYVSNYLATTSIYQIEFNEMQIIIKKEFNWTNTEEIRKIGYKIYEYGEGNVFYLLETVSRYAEEYKSINKPITIVNKIITSLIIPDTIIMKISYLILPLLTIVSIISVFRTNGKYDKKYCEIIDMITILFSFSLMHILTHSMLGSIIDRYTIPALVTTFIGIFLSIYAVIYRKKYKI